MLAGVGALHVEPVWVGKHGRVAVGSGEVDHHQFAPAHQRAGHLGVGAGHPRRELNRRVQSQDLLDRIRPQRRIGGQHRQLVGGVEQHPYPIAQQVDRGLEAGRQHEAGDATKLRLIEADAAVGGVDQLAHQIGAGIVAKLLQVGAQPAIEPLQAALHCLVLRPTEPEIQTGCR